MNTRAEVEMIEVVCTSLRATSRPSGGKIAKMKAWPIALASRPVIKMKNEDLLSRLEADEGLASVRLIIPRRHPRCDEVIGGRQELSQNLHEPGIPANKYPPTSGQRAFHYDFSGFGG